MSRALDPAQIERLDRIADVLIPPAEGRPSAAEADPRGFWLDRILAARPDLVPLLAQIADESADLDPAAAVDRLRAEDPEAFEQLLFISHVRYFMNPRVRRAIGYPGQVGKPQLPGEAEADLEEAGIAEVIARGPIYQVVDDAKRVP
jgi:hypothetical protein